MFLFAGRAGEDLKSDHGRCDKYSIIQFNDTVVISIICIFRDIIVESDKNIDTVISI